MDEEAERRYLDYFVKYVEPHPWGHDKIASVRERMFQRERETPRESYKDRMLRLRAERAKKEEQDKA